MSQKLACRPRKTSPRACIRTLVSEDLEISVPVESDAEELFSVIDDNRDYLREWLPWLDDILSIDDEISMIRNFGTMLMIP